MRKIIILLIAIFIGSCGTPRPVNTRTCTPIQIKVEFERDQHGFVETTKCDSLFFSGLLSASGYKVEIEAAEIESGKWLRRPVSYAECYTAGESRSTISRDQLLGVYWHAWTHKDLDMLERMWDYGVNHLWVMGEGRLAGADTVMNAAMISTLAEMIYQLGGENHAISRNLPVIWDVKENESLYVNRLTALHLGLRKQVYGNIGRQAEQTLQKLVELWPDNPLFRWAIGDICGARHYLTLNKIPSGVHNPDEYIFEKAFVAYQVRER